MNARLVKSIAIGVTIVGINLLGAGARGEDLYLADALALPGGLWRSDAGTAERLLHQRADRPDAAYPRAFMKLGQVAVGPDGKIYFASGLDGYVMHLLDGRNEIAAFEVEGQVRDVACTGEEHTVYFSVVPTPRNDAPLADGKIYRRDLWEGAPTEVATINQAAVGRNWWGAFTIREGVIYLATLEADSRIFKLAGGMPTQIASARGYSIRGLAAAGDRAFHFVTGAGKAYRTTDFNTFETTLTTDRRLEDVALQVPREWGRP